MAQAPTSLRGGLLTRTFQDLSRSWGSEPKAGLVCPRPSKPEAPMPRAPSEPVLGRPVLTTSSSPMSASRDSDAASVEAGLAELRRLFASECSLGTSAPGFGVSPPVRSGAANGLVHDSLWRQEAPRACKASLRTLHERTGPRCLSSCAGDYRLLMTSPDQSLQLLAGAVEDSEQAGSWDEPMRPPSAGMGRTSPAVGFAPPRTSSRTSPVPTTAAGWHPAHCASPEPADLFSY